MIAAAKYCASHKGIFFGAREKHLKMLGFEEEELDEILYIICAHMHANNFLFVSLIANGCPVEEILQTVGPYKDSVYKAE